MLTKEQIVTINRLKKKGINTKMQIVHWCIQKLEAKDKNLRNDKNYFQQIINHIAQKGEI